MKAKPQDLIGRTVERYQKGIAGCVGTGHIMAVLRDGLVVIRDDSPYSGGRLIKTRLDGDDGWRLDDEAADES